MNLSEIECLLTQAIGLDPATIGSTVTGRAVHERQGACQIADSRAYWDRVRTSPTELQALIEAVVVPESWFFRDPAAFAALAQVATERYRELLPGQRLRLLSVPCSTGEEPYSIAVTLLEAGIPANRFHIDAVDVSGRALEVARQGVYRRNSFRGPQLRGHARYFGPVAAGFRIAERIRDLVTFRQGNLLEPSSLSHATAYDVIFCRNVLIYFDGASQDRAVSLLSRALATNGVMFVGTAEDAIVRSRNLRPTAGGQAFMVRGTTLSPPRASAIAAPANPRASGSVSRRPAPPLSVPAPRVASTERTPPPPQAPAMTPSSVEMLDEAMRLANSARFTEAAALCERHAREHGPSPRAFHLSGLVRDAVGDRVGAADFYRKALYLDPQHEETLVHLALILESDDQFSEAGRLRVRARRAAQRQEPER